MYFSIMILSHFSKNSWFGALPYRQPCFTLPNQSITIYDDKDSLTWAQPYNSWAPPPLSPFFSTLLFLFIKLLYSTFLSISLSLISLKNSISAFFQEVSRAVLQCENTVQHLSTQFIWKGQWVFAYSFPLLALVSSKITVSFFGFLYFSSSLRIWKDMYI